MILNEAATYRSLGFLFFVWGMFGASDLVTAEIGVQQERVQVYVPGPRVGTADLANTTFNLTDLHDREVLNRSVVVRWNGNYAHSSTTVPNVEAINLRAGPFGKPDTVLCSVESRVGGSATAPQAEMVAWNRECTMQGDGFHIMNDTEAMGLVNVSVMVSVAGTIVGPSQSVSLMVVDVVAVQGATGVTAPEIAWLLWLVYAFLTFKFKNHPLRTGIAAVGFLILFLPLETDVAQILGAAQAAVLVAALAIWAKQRSPS